MRLIDANEVVKAILKVRDKIPMTVTAAPYELGIQKPYHAGNHMRGGIRKALHCIEQAPTVDAVPVVRCRECIYCDPERHTCRHYMGTTAPLRRKADDFCSYGERKDGGVESEN